MTERPANMQVSFTDGSTKKSLFIQVSSSNADFLRNAINHIAAEHKDPAKDDYIYNVVLNEIGDANGALSPILDVIVPHLPGGGGRQVFDNVFVGSMMLPWQVVGGNAYLNGILDADFRWANLMAQRRLWQAFRSRYPNIPFHFYIDYEADLSTWDIPAIREAYEAYLIQSVRDAHSIWQNRAIMWSPAIWSGVPLNPTERTAIRRTFQNIRYYSNQAGHYKGISWLHLQDMMGRGWARISQEDVRTWYYQLKAAYDFDSLRINMENFRTDWRGQLVPMQRGEMARVENWYQAHGIPLGAAWEIRWWYPNHVEV